MEPHQARSGLVNIEFNPACSTLQATGNARAVAPGEPAAIDALYLHIPFCFHKCHYCDFYSIVDPAGEGKDRQEPFLDALIDEMAHAATRFDLRPKTIFVGGGTPTLLRPALWERLLEAMRDRGVLDAVDEFTVEANPETVTPELAGVLAAGGVNRASIGAQSFQPRLLKALERWHDPANVGRAAGVFRHAGIENVNLDLIFAVPGETPTDLNADLDAALALDPSHLSCYGLTYEPNTPMTVKLRLGRIEPVEEDLEAQMYERVLDRLEDAGFEHYEVSNWARKETEFQVLSSESRAQASAYRCAGPETQRPNRSSSARCQHNLAYWTGRNWLGVGPSASSHVDGRRWKNEAHLGRYLAGSPTPPVIDVEELEPERRAGEALMLGLRLREGVERDWLARVLPEVDERWNAIRGFIEMNLLEETADHLRLTRRGLMVADPLIARLL